MSYFVRLHNAIGKQQRGLKACGKALVPVGTPELAVCRHLRQATEHEAPYTIVSTTIEAGTVSHKY